MRKSMMYLLFVFLLTASFLALCSCGETANPVSGTAGALPESTSALTALTSETTSALSETVTTVPAETTAPDPYAKKNLYFPDILPYVKVLGRNGLAGDCLTFDWTCSSLEFNCDCQGDVRVYFVSGTDLYLSVYIDGVLQPERICVNAPSNVRVAKDLEAGTHTIRIVRGCEQNEASLAEISGITICGSLYMPPENTDNYIEFIGDSITCGYGNLGVRGDKFSNANTDPTQGYAYLTAEAVDADYSMVASSGIGVAGRMIKKITMPEIYTKTDYYRDKNEEYAFDRKATLVVVNLSTNDTTTATWSEEGLDEGTFKEAARTLLSQIRAGHGDVPVVWVYGMMSGGVFTTYICDVLEELGGEAAGYYSLALAQNNDAVDAHCSLAGHSSAAQTLVNFLYEKQLLK